jgi:hypothetical protein
VISRAVANESFVSVDVGRDFKPFPRDQSSEGSSASSFLRELFAVANQLGARIFNRERGRSRAVEASSLPVRCRSAIGPLHGSLGRATKWSQ